MDSRLSLISVSAEIVAAYVQGNKVPPEDLPKLLQSVHRTLVAIGEAPEDAPKDSALEPAVPAKKSVTPEYLICLEDGKKFKSLKRHLRTRYGMTPEEYRAKWGLPPDYPMVAPNYAKARSALAKRMGLGTSRRGA